MYNKFARSVDYKNRDVSVSLWPSNRNLFIRTLLPRIFSFSFCLKKIVIVGGQPRSASPSAYNHHRLHRYYSRFLFCFSKKIITWGALAFAFTQDGSSRDRMNDKFRLHQWCISPATSVTLVMMTPVTRHPLINPPEEQEQHIHNTQFTGISSVEC